MRFAFKPLPFFLFTVIAFLAYCGPRAYAQTTPVPGYYSTAYTGEDTINLCPSAVRSIQFADGSRIELQTGTGGRQWVATKPGALTNVNGQVVRENAFVRELSNSTVDSWFAQNCRFALRWADDYNNPGTPIDTIQIQYFNGNSAQLDQSERSNFSGYGRKFVSDDFADAIQDLKRIAQFQ
ncbi:MAG TPA: hypothetical protein VM432_00185 [Bdellovibrionales bacterium]|jgi:hypothetical protein|nr:hypothetical protein [Bdellovibrionales bacterium]